MWHGTRDVQSWDIGIDWFVLAALLPMASQSFDLPVFHATGTSNGRDSKL